MAKCVELYPLIWDSVAKMEWWKQHVCAGEFYKIYIYTGKNISKFATLDTKPRLFNGSARFTMFSLGVTESKDS
jgi:hypothetical protein